MNRQRSRCRAMARSSDAGWLELLLSPPESLAAAIVHRQPSLLIKPTRLASCATAQGGISPYFIEVLSDVSLSARVEPIPFTMTMIASAMLAAIKQYSIAVAPDSSCQNLTTQCFMMLFLFLLRPLRTFRPGSTIGIQTAKDA